MSVRADVSARLENVDKPLHLFRQIVEVVVLSLAGTPTGVGGNFVQQFLGQALDRRRLYNRYPVFNSFGTNGLV
jgi:hypothetical protein